MIGAYMMNDFIERAVAVTLGILDLLAYLPERLVFPAHFGRRQVPDWIAGHAAVIDIRLLVADRTSQRRKPEAIFTAEHRRLMRAAQIALARAVAGRMAIRATWMREHLGGFGKQRG